MTKRGTEDGRMLRKAVRAGAVLFVVSWVVIAAWPVKEGPSGECVVCEKRYTPPTTVICGKAIITQPERYTAVVEGKSTKGVMTRTSVQLTKSVYDDTQLGSVMILDDSQGSMLFERIMLGFVGGLAALTLALFTGLIMMIYFDIEP